MNAHTNYLSKNIYFLLFFLLLFLLVFIFLLSETAKIELESTGGNSEKSEPRPNFKYYILGLILNAI